MASFLNQCALCGVTYTAERSTARYCTDAHRTEAGRDRRLDALRVAASALLIDQTQAILDRQLAIHNGDIVALRDADRRLVTIDDRTTALFAPSPRRTRGA